MAPALFVHRTMALVHVPKGVFYASEAKLQLQKVEAGRLVPEISLVR